MDWLISEDVYGGLFGLYKSVSRQYRLFKLQTHDVVWQQVGNGHTICAGGKKKLASDNPVTDAPF